jgi:hypothetical protein
VIVSGSIEEIKYSAKVRRPDATAIVRGTVNAVQQLAAKGALEWQA